MEITEICSLACLFYRGQLSYDTLHRWIREFKTDPQNSFRGSGHLRPDEEEIRWLKKENQDLREENAILKKATAIFANHRK